MPRIAPIDPSTAGDEARTLLDQVRKKLGGTPNMLATLAHSPAALRTYLGAGQALSGAAIDAGLREQIALTVAGANTCTYCASAHTVLGGRAGVDEAEIAENLHGRSADPRVQAALTFASALVERRGYATDEQVEAVRDAGFSDGEILEIVTVVAINILTNYINHVAQPEIDFPRVEVGETVAA